MPSSNRRSLKRALVRALRRSRAGRRTLALLTAGRSPAATPPATLAPANAEPDAELVALRAKVVDLERQLTEAQQNAARYSTAYRMLSSAPEGLYFWEVGPTQLEAPTRDEAREVRHRIARLRQDASFIEAISEGKSLVEATTDHVRNYLTVESNARMRVLSESLRRSPDTAVAGELGWALVARYLKVPDKAWDHFARVPAQYWRRLVPVEYIETAQSIGPEAVVTVAEQLLAEPADDVPIVGWVALARSTFAVGRHDLSRRAQRLAAHAASHDEAIADDLRADIDWLGSWLDRVERPAPAVVVPAGGIAVGVLGYKQPDRRWASQNIGDYLQTVASLGHLVRHRGVRFNGPDDLVDAINALQSRVVESKRIDGPEADVTLIPINRDASSLDSVPESTWLLAFGWYLHRTFGRFDFPLHPNIRPLFVSFHCNQLRMLTRESIDYLKRYGPIGCRDWTTVYVLHSVGVPAFFSGCITTTIDTIGSAGSAPAGRKRGTAFVDKPPPEGIKGERISHSSEEVQHRTLAQNLVDATASLDDYRHKYARIVTSRLHCYLPARSVGADVEFVARNPADPRFNGLVGLDPAAFDAIRDTMNERLASTLSLGLSGAGEDEVYAHWRALNDDDVEAARRRIEAVPALPAPKFDVDAACHRIRSERVDVGADVSSPATVHVTMALDGNLKEQLSVVVQGLTTHASRPLHLWILCRDHDDDDYARMARLFPDARFTWLPCDHVDYGEVGGLIGHTTRSTLDRLLLPQLLEELDRVVYIDVDVLPVGDIAALYDWDLSGTPVAARRGPAVDNSGYAANIMSTALRQRARPELADDLLRRMAAAHPYDFSSCNAGVLVLDLARMRKDDFCRNFIPFVELYGMNDQEVLNAYAGAGRAELPAEWNHVPSHERIDSPLLIHWAGRVKPWHGTAPMTDRWMEYASMVAARVAATASADS